VGEISIMQKENPEEQIEENSQEELKVHFNQ
jgi:hypothetical protein